MKNLKSHLGVLFIVISLTHSLPAQSEPSPFAEENSEKECRDEYDKITPQVEGQRRAQSQKQIDAQACRGVVGESFCLEEKEKAFIAQCRKRKASSPKPVEIKLPTEETQPESSDENKSDKEESSDGFKEM